MDTIAYAVYSELEEGFLVEPSPSLWHFGISSAMRYATDTEARTAAAKRRSALAIPVRLYEADGEICWEPIPAKAPPLGGTWIIRIEDLDTPGRIWYLVKGGAKLSISMREEDAKPYKTEAAAIKAQDQVNVAKSFRAERIQITAKVLPFR